MNMKETIQKFDGLATLLKNAMETENPKLIIEAAETVRQELADYAEDMRSIFKIYLIIKNDRIVAIKSSEAALVSKELKLEKHKVEGVTVYTDYDKAFEDAKEVKDSYIIAVGIDGKFSQQKLEISDAPAGQMKIDDIDKLKYSVGLIKEGADHAEMVVKVLDEKAVFAWIRENYLEQKTTPEDNYVSVEYYTEESRNVIPTARIEEFLDDQDKQEVEE